MTNLSKPDEILASLNDESGDSGWAHPNAYNQIAQVKASLYLAEQQRIANLIAFVALSHGQIVDGFAPNAAGYARLEVAVDQIIEGLGL